MARTINSPGVQITEKDLSLRIDIPVGTQVYVPGFASQGPTSEPLMITSTSELEAIYGIPSTPAERYFYYSCKEILNSPAILNTIRLPYGSGTGSDYANSYSALFYPMLSAGTSTGAISSWEIGAPTYKSLSQADYDVITQDNYEWIVPNTNVSTVTSNVVSLSTITYTNATSSVGLNIALSNDHDGNNITISHPNASTTSFTFSLTSNVVTTTATVSSLYNKTNGGDVTIAAGFFILNDLQTVINEGAEGYYVGFADNSAVAANSPDFDSIKGVTTLSAVSAFGELKTERLDFSLSATKLDSDRGRSSISESLEKVGFIGFETESYQDHLSLGVYKIRKSTADPSLLTLATTEKYLGSFDSTRKQSSPTGGILANSFIEDAVNGSSPTIKMFINPAISKNFDWTVNSITPTTRVTVGTGAQKLFPVGVYAADTRAVDDSKQIGLVPQKLDKVLRKLENIEDTTVDVLIDAGLSTIYSTTSQFFSAAKGSFDDTAFVGPLSSVNVIGDGSIEDDWRSVVNVLINFSQYTRQDCFTIIDPPRSVFVTGKNTKVIDIPGNSFTLNVYAPLKNCVDEIETNYAAIYANWVKNNDMFTGRNVWLPFSGYAAAVFGRNDAAANTWGAPAGLNRGIFTALDIGFNPNFKQRDRLYEIATNPVVLFNGDGFAVFGQKTLQNKPTAFDRINVRRLFLTLERAVRRTIKYFVFEPNTLFTRKRVVTTISPVFDYAKATEGLYDFLIVCDERNNTPDSIDRNEMIVDIYLKPVRTAEFILVNFIATRTGQDFSELI